jgi:hypothetical protein
MRKSIRGFAIATAFTCTLVAGALDAGAVTLSKQNNSDTFNGGGKDIVSGISNRGGSFYAGGFRLTDGSQNFIAWCLDILNNLTLPASYDITNTPFTNTGNLSVTQKTNIEKLFETSYSTLDLGNSANGNTQSAGFQLALWEIVYETNEIVFGLDVTDGSWTVTSPAAAIAMANTFLGNLANNITQDYQLTFYQDSVGGVQSQNLVSATPIPVPPAALLLFGGLIGLGYLSRRHSKA